MQNQGDCPSQIIVPLSIAKTEETNGSDELQDFTIHDRPLVGYLCTSGRGCNTEGTRKWDCMRLKITLVSVWVSRVWAMISISKFSMILVVGRSEISDGSGSDLVMLIWTWLFENSKSLILLIWMFGQFHPTVLAILGVPAWTYSTKDLPLQP